MIDPIAFDWKPDVPQNGQCRPDLVHEGIRVLAIGLTVDVCPECRRMNPRGVGEAAADNCHACGAVLRPTAVCSFCAEPITLLGDCWTTGDGTTSCSDTSAPYVPHKPAAPVCRSCSRGEGGGGYPCDCPSACGARYCQHPAENNASKEN